MDSPYLPNVSHNDLKPQNILVEREVARPSSRILGEAADLEDVWVWTKRHGTEAYMAPEVALDGKRGRNVSDIYSLGVLLYEMATGRLPYVTPHQLLTGVLVAKPRETNRDIPIALEAIILRAMARRPNTVIPTVCPCERRWPRALPRCARLGWDKTCYHGSPRASSVSAHPRQVRCITFELAKLRLAENDAQGALEAAEAAVDRSDGHPQYVRMLGGICMRLGYHRKAAEAYERLLATYERGYPVEPSQSCEDP